MAGGFAGSHFNLLRFGRGVLRMLDFIAKRGRVENCRLPRVVVRNGDFTGYLSIDAATT
jgi:hypothetical protein